MAKRRSIIVVTDFCRVRLMSSRVRHVVRVGIQNTTEGSVEFIAELPVADFLDRLGVASEASSECFAIFAGEGATPRGGIRDFVCAFPTLGAAKASFERLCPHADWAQLVRLRAGGGAEVLCWRGSHATPRTRADLELLLDVPPVTATGRRRPAAAAGTNSAP